MQKRSELMQTCRARRFLLIVLSVDKVISLLLHIFLFPVPLDLFINSLRILLPKLGLMLV